MRIHSRKVRKTECLSQQRWYWPRYCHVGLGREKVTEARALLALISPPVSSRARMVCFYPSPQLMRIDGRLLGKKGWGEGGRTRTDFSIGWCLQSKHQRMKWKSTLATWLPTQLSRSPHHRGALWLVRICSFNKYLPSTYHMPDIVAHVRNTYIMEG